MTKTPHKHAAVIHAYADGAAVQMLAANGAWITPAFPDFDPEREYRIKPEPPKYPQTNLTDKEMMELWEAGSSTPNIHRSIANTAIARAIQDGQVAIIRPEGVTPGSHPATVHGTEYCMEVIGQGRIFGTKKVVDYVASKLLDTPDQIDAPKPGDDVEPAEAAFWQFDARRKGYSEWSLRPQSERDAFKAVYRKAVADMVPATMLEQVAEAASRATYNAIRSVNYNIAYCDLKLDMAAIISSVKEGKG